ncbi:beta strand repeat-containing protein [Aestuariivirga litoralis]|uniref:beta strand repeat-containing protein n=1 Tax=Aestuariivirga litoralis TaxID=2650924 RepID=UPI0018C46959|nr:hypothetical protein [Aestuariivirga litoralis]
MGAFLGPEFSSFAAITNTATAVGSGPSGPLNSAPVTAAVPVAGGSPALTLSVVTTAMTDNNGNGQYDAGDTINYAYTITNTGNVTLNHITITDTGVTVTGGPIASLAPGQSDAVTFAGAHSVGLLDILAGSYHDAAVAAGMSASGGAQVSANGSVTTALHYTSGLSLTVAGAFTTAHPKAGDIVNYTYTVKNTGLSLLTNIVLNDPLFAFNDARGNDRMIALLDGASNPAAPEFATASLGGKQHRYGVVESAHRRLAAKRGMTGLVAPEFNTVRQLVRMSGKTGPVEAGEKIGFLFNLTNAGDAPLTGIRIDQPDSFAFGSAVSLLNPNETDAASIIFTRDLTAEELAAGEVKSNAYVTWHVRGHESLLALQQGLPLSGIKTYDDFKTASLFPITIPLLNPGQSQDTLVPYTLTQHDMDAGTTSTTATATALDLASLTLSQSGSTSLPLTQDPAIGMVKTGTITPTDGVSAKPGDKISYHLAITNTGNVTLTNVLATDTGAVVSGTPIASLAPGVTNNSSFTAQYTLTQADIDHGLYQNQAKAQGTSPAAVDVTADSDNADPAQHRPTVTPITPVPVIGLLKQVTGVTDTNHNGFNDVGDVIGYKFTIYNLGNVTLSDINITDTPGGGALVVIAGNPLASLAPGATSTAISGSYAITQADVDAGHVDNTATVTGTAPDGTKVSHDSDPGVPTQSAPTVLTITQQPQVALYKKQASVEDKNSDGIVDAGDVIHYSFIVQNTGNVALANVIITDQLAGATVTGSAITLAPGATDATSFTAAYTISAADEQAAIVHNRAKVDAVQQGTSTAVSAVSKSGDLTTSADTTTDTVVSPTPAIGLLLQTPSYADTNSNGLADAGDTLTYNIQVKNLSSVAFNSIVLTDNAAGLSLTGSLTGTLLPGAVDTTTFNASHALTAADMTAGRYDAQSKVTAALASGAGTQISALSDLSDFAQHRITPYVIAANPQVALYKKQTSFDDTNGDGVISAGDVLHYSFIAQNTGNVALDHISLTDAMAGVTVAGNTNSVALAPGANDASTFTATYTVTSADAAAGAVHNRARINATQVGIATAVTAQSLSGDLVSSTNTTTDTVIVAAPTIAALLLAPSYADSNGDGVVNAGDTLTYQVQVKNTGVVALGTITLADNIAGLTFNGSYSGSLAAGATDTATFTATHVIAAADLTAGHYDAQAKVSGTAGSLVVSGLSDLSDFAQARVTPYAITAKAQIALYKKQASFDDANSDGVVDAGDVIHYSFIVKNSGNVPLDNITLSDTLSGVTLTGNGNSVVLAPAATDGTIFTGTYTVTAADEQAGIVQNRAHVIAAQAGSAITASAASRSGDPASSTDATTDTVIASAPALSALLPAPSYADTNGDNVVNAGDTLTYQVQIKNTGIAALNAITLTDSSGGLTITGSFSGALAPGATDTTSFTARHVITLADLVSGHYDAQIKVAGSTGGQPATALTDVLDFAQHRITPYLIAPMPQIAALQQFDHFEDAAGAVVPAAVSDGYAVYRITVHNTGNVAFDTVNLALNGSFSGTVIGSAILALPAGAVNDTQFKLRHKIMNAEILAGQIDSQVLVTGNNTADGVSATDATDPAAFSANAVTIVPVAVDPGIGLVKTFTVEDVNGNKVNDAGDIIHYAFNVVNTGNIDLTNVKLIDAGAAQPSPAPEITALAAGASDTTSLTASHVIMATDVAAGNYTNQAKVSARYDATQPDITALSDNASIDASSKRATVTPLELSKASFTKTAARSQVKRGEPVVYTISAASLLGDAYQIADIMPPGFAYVTGSAKVNGVAVKPLVKGQVLTFNSLVPQAGKISVVLTLNASSTSSAGKFVNNAKLVDQSNNALIASAQAVVEVMPDASFDCSDIIGRVFDDLNGDGYQQDGEPGLPAVRVATVNGLLITTDAQGRFHVPCAAIPDAAIGSNFVMKLDPRSLPAGYNITTENPRDVRLTRGKATELNFGAGRLHQVKLDFSGQAFVDGTANLTPRWTGGIGKLVGVLKSRRSDLILVYHQGKESGELAQSRVDAVMARVRQAWSNSGNAYPLGIKFDMEGAQ